MWVRVKSSSSTPSRLSGSRLAAGGGDEAPGLAGEVVGAVGGVHDEALLAERVEQAVRRSTRSCRAPRRPRRHAARRRRDASSESSDSTVRAVPTPRVRGRRRRRPPAGEFSVMLLLSSSTVPGRGAVDPPAVSRRPARVSASPRRYIAATAPRRPSAARVRNCRKTASFLCGMQRTALASGSTEVDHRPEEPAMSAVAESPTRRMRPRRRRAPSPAWRATPRCSACRCSSSARSRSASRSWAMSRPPQPPAPCRSSSRRPGSACSSPLSGRQRSDRAWSPASSACSRASG